MLTSESVQCSSSSPALLVNVGFCLQIHPTIYSCGWFNQKGHVIPGSLVNEVREMAREVFNLPYDEKVKIKMSAATGFRGYQRIGENVTKGKPDMHEAVDVRRQSSGIYGVLGKALEGSTNDISPLLEKCNDLKMGEDSGVTEVVKQLDKACRESGFFYVKGHGIPDSLVKEVRETARKFFDLPYDQKLEIKMSAATGYRGYQTLRLNITEGKPDLHEAIDYLREYEPGKYGDLGKALEGSNKWPRNPSNFQSVMEEYISLLTDLSRIIMRGISLALSGLPDEFERDQRFSDSFWAMRMIGYPGIPDSNGSGKLDNETGCGAHTDYGLLTLVNQDDEIPALQLCALNIQPILVKKLLRSRFSLPTFVKNPSGEWIWAVPIPGTFVCNIGDMLKILTNGLYESTVHQVINNSPNYRVSIAYFYEPNFNAVIEPLDLFKDKVGGTAKCERACYGEHLVGKVLTNFVEPE